MSYASFRGRHNEVKAKTMILLCQGNRWYTTHDIARIIGVKERSLYTLLPRWHRWQRVRRHFRPKLGVFEYSSGAKGREWLNRWQFDMPLERYIAEIKQYQASRLSKNGRRGN